MTQSVEFSWAGMGAELANHLWQSTAFVILVALLTWMLRGNRAQARYRLWMTASVKFLVPLSLLTKLGGLLPKRQLPAAPQFAMYSVFDVAGQPFSGLAGQHVPLATDAMASMHRLMTRLPAILGMLWMCGAAVVLLVWYARWRQISAISRRAQRLKEGREAEILRQVEKRLPVSRPIQLLRSNGTLEPGICGIFRPRLLWPERLSGHLNDAQIEAIVMHERMHVERHDNLTALIHMVVEAVFWFHPMVWWMEARLVEERELACDEAVIELVDNADAYAEGLLKACRFCVESPLVCMPGISGADLRKRVVHIMSGPAAHKVSFGSRLLLAGVALISITAPIVFGQVNAGLRTSIPIAQPPPPPPPPPPRLFRKS